VRKALTYNTAQGTPTNHIQLTENNTLSPGMCDHGRMMLACCVTEACKACRGTAPLAAAKKLPESVRASVHGSLPFQMCYIHSMYSYHSVLPCMLLPPPPLPLPCMFVDLSCLACLAPAAPHCVVTTRSCLMCSSPYRRVGR
jgi:hypothetical protein